jgi:hypothetical protein
LSLSLSLQKFVKITVKALLPVLSDLDKQVLAVAFPFLSGLQITRWQFSLSSLMDSRKVIDFQFEF